MKRTKFVGLDVHAETITVVVAEQEGEMRSLGVIPNREESIRKLVKKLGPVEQLRMSTHERNNSELSSDPVIERLEDQIGWYDVLADLICNGTYG